MEREFWVRRIHNAWKDAPIAWLCGVRRSGKTTLAQSLESAVTWMNCDLPSSAQRLNDPELFYQNVSTPIVVFDEIHQLKDPSRVLKIAADQFPNLKILATGSSTLAASSKFRDSLTGRKRVVHLVPVLWDELPAFGVSLEQRLLHGGLPQPLLSTAKNHGYFREWMDSFFARDIQKLFGFRDISRFTAVLEFALQQSGGQFEVGKASRVLGISRPTITNHLRALEITQAVTLLRPFHQSRVGELTKMPKVYGFDTGFVSFVRGWEPLRHDDLGSLWEHIVLEYLQAHRYHEKILYWRDKAGHEVDFVIARDRAAVDAIECKWDADRFDPGALRVFRTLHPRGRNFLVTPRRQDPYQRRYGDLEVTVGPPDILKPDPV